jgi:hypothetical protein
LDDFADLASLQSDINARELIDLQRDAGAQSFIEPAFLHRYRVLTRPETGDGVGALIVSFDLDADVRPDICYGYHCLGHQRARGIFHFAGDRRKLLLREHG